MKNTKEIKLNLKLYFQLFYIFIFILSTIGICGNIELNIQTPIINIIICIISGILTFGKFIYCSQRY